MIFWISILAVLVIDQGSKFLIRKNLSLYESIPIIPDFFHLTYIENPGAAFGILAHKRIFFIIITILILVGIFYFYFKLKKEQWLLKIALGLVVGGAIGNFIDRLRWGAVIDFLDFRIWPVFNIADTAIIIGMLIIAYQILIKGEEV